MHLGGLDSRTKPDQASQRSYRFLDVRDLKPYALSLSDEYSTRDNAPGAFGIHCQPGTVLRACNLKKRQPGTNDPSSVVGQKGQASLSVNKLMHDPVKVQLDY